MTTSKLLKCSNCGCRRRSLYGITELLCNKCYKKKNFKPLIFEMNKIAKEILK